MALNCIRLLEALVLRRVASFGISSPELILLFVVSSSDSARLMRFSLILAAFCKRIPFLDTLVLRLGAWIGTSSPELMLLFPVTSSDSESGAG